MGGIEPEEAMKRCNAQEVIAASEFEPRLRQLARTHTVVNTLDMQDESFVVNPARKELIATLRRTFATVEMIDKDIISLRAIKTDEEIRRIRRACDLTVATFARIRDQFATYKYEYQLEADFTAGFRSHAATHAYAPIVAAGDRACTLHYDKNAESVHARDLVVIDIGARVDGYAADVTRTYALKPSKRQQAVHAAVQQAHDKIIALLAPGLLVAEYAHSVDEIMKDALISLGLLASKDDETTYRKYFPHAVSHGLGVDVHDSLGSPRYFEPGMVITVEPGIYIPEEGIGVRIEDDILITENGHDNLTRKLSTDL
jgi:Xaa-Pro aminopeptidase